MFMFEKKKIGLVQATIVKKIASDSREREIVLIS